MLKVNESTKSDVAFTSVSISQDSRYVAAGSLDGVIRVWDLIAIPEDAAELEGAKLVDRLRGHEKSVYSVKFVHGHNARDRGDTLISGSLDKTLKRWEVGPFETTDVVPGASPPAEGAGENGSTCVKTYRGHNVRYSRWELETFVLTSLISGLCLSSCDCERRSTLQNCISLEGRKRTTVGLEDWYGAIYDTRA